MGRAALVPGLPLRVLDTPWLRIVPHHSRADSSSLACWRAAEGDSLRRLASPSREEGVDREEGTPGRPTPTSQTVWARAPQGDGASPENEPNIRRCDAWELSHNDGAPPRGAPSLSFGLVFPALS
jgi:hypothetical protein